MARYRMLSHPISPDPVSQKIFDFCFLHVIVLLFCDHRGSKTKSVLVREHKMIWFTILIWAAVTPLKPSTTFTSWRHKMMYTSEIQKRVIFDISKPYQITWINSLTLLSHWILCSQKIVWLKNWLLAYQLCVPPLTNSLTWL